MVKKRDAPSNPEGRKGRIPLGGKAGRRPGMGNRNTSGTTPGGEWRCRPLKGFGMSNLMGRRRPPQDPPRPKPKTK